MAAAVLSTLGSGCTTGVRLSTDDSPVVLAEQRLAGPSPATAGPRAMRTLFYGSGTDRQRAEFRDSVTLRTRAVDASKFLSWPEAERDSRRKYWGFDVKAVPLNARVWYPEGTGPFPLVLVVHGNHDPKDYSDPGYAYLGEHLASRGYILASVDMNFVNGATRGENDARGWLLLKHLEAWRGFNDSSASPLAGKVDLSNIALMGHSRGGEAVGHAAAFNRMERYPDDANVKFDFNFGIRSLVAIAPVDGQYRPAERFVPIENVSYLVFHGSHDGDVSTFHGLRQYQRLQFTDDGPWFKSAVYMYRANHGQWNSVWGPLDNGRRSPRRLELRALIEPEAQREFALVYITTFLDATLRGDRHAVALFRDHRAAGQWLPNTMYITRFEEATFRPVATFEEDVDVGTGTLAGVTLHGDSLSTWREARVPYRGRGTDTQENSAVWLGWNSRVAGVDTAARGRPASYTIDLADATIDEIPMGDGAVLSLLLAPTRETPGPRAAARDTAARDTTSGARPRPRTPATPKVAPDTMPIDLTIELVDAAGVRARLPLSRYGAIRRPLDVFISRRRGRDAEGFARTFEYVLQSYLLPLADFSAATPEFDASRVRQVRLVFDRSLAGTVILDHVGFSRPDPAFLVAR